MGFPILSLTLIFSLSKFRARNDKVIWLLKGVYPKQTVLFNASFVLPEQQKYFWAIRTDHQQTFGGEEKEEQTR